LKLEKDSIRRKLEAAGLKGVLSFKGAIVVTLIILFSLGVIEIIRTKNEVR